MYKLNLLFHIIRPVFIFSYTYKHIFTAMFPNTKKKCCSYFSLKNSYPKLCVVLFPVLRWQRHADICEFRGNMVYIISSCPAKTEWWDCSNKQTDTNFSVWKNNRVLQLILKIRGKMFQRFKHTLLWDKVLVSCKDLSLFLV